MSCAICNASKAPQTCRACESSICKNCVEFVSDETFEYADYTDANSPVGFYCSSCYTTDIVPKVDEYEEIVGRAREVTVFNTTQTKEARLIKRTDMNLKIDECEDKDVLLMKLAYLAAKAGHDTLVDVDLVYTKKRDGSFKLANWAGTANATTGGRGVVTNSNRRSPSR